MVKFHQGLFKESALNLSFEQLINSSARVIVQDAHNCKTRLGHACMFRFLQVAKKLQLALCGSNLPLCLN